MRVFKIVVFIVVLYAAAAWGGEINVSPMGDFEGANGYIYGPGGEIEGYTLEFGDSDPIYPIHRGSVTVIPDDITDLLSECLEYIEDGSVDQRFSFSPVYRPLTRDGVAQDEADRAQYEAERCRRETEVHGKIKEMITKLEGSK